MGEFSEIKNFLETHYQIEVQKVFKLTPKTFKIVTNNHDYLLKFAIGDDEFVMKQLFAYKVLPQSVLPIYRTNDKLHDVKVGEQFGYLTDYVQVIPVPLEKQVHYYLELLTKLHRETELIVDISDEEMMRFYDNEYEKLQSCYAHLQRNIEIFELKLDRSPYEWYFMMVYPMLYAMLHRANDELKKFYDKLKKEKKMPTCLVQRDINVANLLVSEKSTYLINFEKSEFGMSGLDMSSFLKNYHQVPGVHTLILNYIKNEKSPILKHYFFFKALCIDLSILESSLHPHSLTKIALLNEMMAPHILGMEVYDQLHKPPPPPEKKNPLKEVLKA